MAKPKGESRTESEKSVSFKQGVLVFIFGTVLSIIFSKINAPVTTDSSIPEQSFKFGLIVGQFPQWYHDIKRLEKEAKPELVTEITEIHEAELLAFEHGSIMPHIPNSEPELSQFIERHRESLKKLSSENMEWLKELQSVVEVGNEKRKKEIDEAHGLEIQAFQAGEMFGNYKPWWYDDYLSSGKVLDQEEFVQFENGLQIGLKNSGETWVVNDE